MKCLLRVLFGLLAGLSLVLCMASAVFWVRGYSTVDAWGVQKERRYVMGSWHGNLYHDLRATPDRCPECGWTVDARRD